MASAFSTKQNRHNKLLIDPKEAQAFGYSRSTVHAKASNPFVANQVRKSFQLVFDLHVQMNHSLPLQKTKPLMLLMLQINLDPLCRGTKIRSMLLTRFSRIDLLTIYLTIVYQICRSKHYVMVLPQFPFQDEIIEPQSACHNTQVVQPPQTLCSFKAMFLHSHALLYKKCYLQSIVYCPQHLIFPPVAETYLMKTTSLLSSLQVSSFNLPLMTWQRL